MKNADKPAAPFQEVTSMVGGVPTGYKNHNGLTKREMFAMHAMQGILAGNSLLDLTDIAKAACVSDANEIIKSMAYNAADKMLED